MGSTWLFKAKHLWTVETGEDLDALAERGMLAVLGEGPWLASTSCLFTAKVFAGEGKKEPDPTVGKKVHPGCSGEFGDSLMQTPSVHLSASSWTKCSVKAQ